MSPLDASFSMAVAMGNTKDSAPSGQPQHPSQEASAEPADVEMVDADTIPNPLSANADVEMTNPPAPTRTRLPKSSAPPRSRLLIRPLARCSLGRGGYPRRDRLRLRCLSYRRPLITISLLSISSRTVLACRARPRFPTFGLRPCVHPMLSRQLPWNSKEPPKRPTAPRIRLPACRSGHGRDLAPQTPSSMRATTAVSRRPWRLCADRNGVSVC